MVSIATEPYSPETKALLDAVDNVFSRLVRATPDSLGTDNRSILLMGFGSLALEHFRAIYMLCHSQVAIGSALALLRPMLDAISRGGWLYACASDEQVYLFMNRSFDFGGFGFKKLALCVDQTIGNGSFLSSFNEYYKQMSDYTHTGHDALCGRIANDGGIEPNYSEARIRILLTTTTRMIVLHFVTACRITGHTVEEGYLTELFSIVDQLDIPGFVYPAPS